MFGPDVGEGEEYVQRRSVPLNVRPGPINKRLEGDVVSPPSSDVTRITPAFPPGVRANALLAPDHVKRLGAFFVFRPARCDF
jgi:hypothetical protein